VDVDGGRICGCENLQVELGGAHGPWKFPLHQWILSVASQPPLLPAIHILTFVDPNYSLPSGHHLGQISGSGIHIYKNFPPQSNADRSPTHQSPTRWDRTAGIHQLFQPG
jgi:hypothetical protein